ncbi:MAG: DUF5995 family protein [bacterium]
MHYVARDRIPETIDEVLADLDVVIARARGEKSRLGYFAVLYRNVTLGVKNAIAEGRFEDGPRMERLDVAFANRYLTALEAWRFNKPVSHCWTVAFNAATRRRPIILQHLLLGVNAHINLDLGLAAVATCTAENLASFQRDFQEVTTLLEEMIDDVQERLDRVSPWMAWLDRIGHRSDEVLCGFCIDKSRKLAWGAAEEMIVVPEDARSVRETELDLVVAGLALPIARPALIATIVLACIGLREESDVGRVMDTLLIAQGATTETAPAARIT